MNLLHIKLKNGEDILAKDQSTSLENVVVVAMPISVHMDPLHGFFAKSWMVLSDIDVVSINKNDIMFCYPASQHGVNYYEEFMKKHIRYDDDIESDAIDDLEKMFEAMLESKSSKIH